MPVVNFDLCVVVPALNEEANIQNTVETIILQGDKNNLNLQIILIDDGSTDQTQQHMDTFATKYKSVSIVKHESSKGLAASFRAGIELAQAPYLTVIPGDNAFAANGINTFFKCIGTAELIITYRQDQYDNRSLLRFLLSKVFSFIMSCLFVGGIRDYHSMVAYPVDRLRSLTLIGESAAYQLEAVVKMLRLKPTIVQTPVSINLNPETKSSTLKFKSLNQLFSIIIELLFKR